MVQRAWVMAAAVMAGCGGGGGPCTPFTDDDVPAVGVYSSCSTIGGCLGDAGAQCTGTYVTERTVTDPTPFCTVSCAGNVMNAPDCPGHADCLGGLCAPHCRGGASCPSNAVCDNGTCIQAPACQ